MAHEINHNIGPNTWGRHVGDGNAGSPNGCGAAGPDSEWRRLYPDDVMTHELGWEPVHGLVPATHTELMSYCGTGDPTKWISSYRWERLVDRFMNFVSGEPKAPMISDDSSSSLLSGNAPTLVPLGSTTTRTISGYVTDSGDFVIDPTFEMLGYAPTLPVPSDIVSPDFEIQVTYENGTSLHYPEALGKFEDVEGNPTKRQYFTLTFPDNGQIADISVISMLSGTNQTVFATKATGFTATGSVTVPSNMARNQPTQIGVQFDADNYTALFFQWEYSPDGQMWFPLGGPSKTPDFSLLISTLPGGDSALLKLSVSDGIQTTRRTSNKFTVPWMNPQMRIREAHRLYAEAQVKGNETSVEVLDAGNKVRIPLGSTVSFKGTLSGPDLATTGNKISWSVGSSATTQNEALAAVPADGDVFVYQFIRAGTFEVTATGTSGTSGLSDSDSITVEVYVPEFPTLESYQQWNAELDNLITLHGTEDQSSPANSDGTDASGNLLPFNWTSVLVALVAIPAVSIIRKKKRF